MKATFTFDLPEEHHEYMDHVHAKDYGYSIEEYDSWLRSILKYGEKSEAEDAVYQICRDRLREILEENDALNAFE